MNRLENALQFLKLGISVIPLLHRNKKPDAALIGGGWEKYTTILSTNEEVYAWLASDWCNYGVICGWSNLVVLDFDSLDYFGLWHLWARAAGLARVVETSFKVLTARGVHVYLRTHDAAANEKRVGIDVQAQHKFVVGPGCTHATGTQYVPVGALRLVQVESVESVLPIELFPSVRPDASCGQTGASWNPLSTDDRLKSATNNTEYDPFQMAMFAGGADLISTVKSRVRIETLFTDVQKTSRDGRWLVTLCPFHDDHNPSMWIDAQRQICGCATCGMRPMDAVNLYARMHNLSDADAVRVMAQELGVWG